MWNFATSREPAPTNDTRVNIGDVGFIRNGRFHLLFSAGCPLGERELGVHVPITFEELTIGTPVFGQPRLPGCLRTETVREVGLMSMPRCLPPCMFYPLNYLHSVAERYTTQAPGTRRAFLIRAHRNPWGGTGDEALHA